MSTALIFQKFSMKNVAKKVKFKNCDLAWMRMLSYDEQAYCRLHASRSYNELGLTNQSASLTFFDILLSYFSLLLLQ